MDPERRKLVVEDSANFLRFDDFRFSGLPRTELLRILKDLLLFYVSLPASPSKPVKLAPDAPIGLLVSSRDSFRRMEGVRAPPPIPLPAPYSDSSSLMDSMSPRRIFTNERDRLLILRSESATGCAIDCVCSSHSRLKTFFRLN